MEHWEEVVGLLDLEQAEDDRFVGGHPSSRPPRVFGGQVLAQALCAAGRTAPADRVVHSLHAYFLAAGTSDSDITFEVERLRDGRSISARRVVAHQGKAPIFELLASFGQPSEASDRGVRDVGVESPESLQSLRERLEPFAAEHGGWWVRPRAFDLRYVDLHPREVMDRPGSPQRRSRVWMKSRGAVPDDRLTRACLLAYLSDMTLLEPVMIGAGRTTLGPGSIASLDHAMWFHRDVGPSEWLLYDRSLVHLSAHRGLASGQMLTVDGALVCTVAQEGHLSDRSPLRVGLPES
ncbi:MAG: acyl-CoA thioesterase [Nocardioidaceae bacterium]|jgi:acyl-CoA thioesterase-2|nr:acyl-CoA thioesterase [Nocardioidaceae bacterium]